MKRRCAWWGCGVVGFVCLLGSVHVGAQGAVADVAAWTLPFRMRWAAHAVPSAPHVVVHAPAGFDARAPLHLVVFLHGFSGCATVLMEEGMVACREGDPPQSGWGLAARHDEAGTQSLFILPQLAFLQRSGDPGCFARTGCFRSFVMELLRDKLKDQLPQHGKPRIGSLTLTAHSGGYQAAQAILQHGGIAVDHVVLLDALYGGAEVFADWIASRQGRMKHSRLISLYHGYGKTRRQSQHLHALLRKRLGDTAIASIPMAALPSALASALKARRYVMSEVATAHALIPARHLAEVLSALGLPARSPAATPR